MTRKLTRLQVRFEDLKAIQEKRFLVFVLWIGVLHFGLIADGVVALIDAVAGDSFLFPPAKRFIILILPVFGAIWAAILWVSVYLYFRRRQSGP